jgi:hypothetical protein
MARQALFMVRPSKYADAPSTHQIETKFGKYNDVSRLDDGFSDGGCYSAAVASASAG